MKRFMLFILFVLLTGIFCLAVAEGEGFTIYYHEGFDEQAEEQTTYVEYGTSTATITIDAFGYQEVGRVFTGWAVHKDEGDAWRVKSTADNAESWMSFSGTVPPEGFTYVLYPNGGEVARTANSGRVDFYAQWREASYSVFYYETEESEPSETVTQVTYGVNTATETIEALGFQTTDRLFTGWKVFRDDTEQWRLKKGDGGEEWKKLENGSLPAGYEYAVWNSGTTVARTVKSGSVHFYATWIRTTFDVTDEMFGANGSDTIDDKTAIQKALNMAKQINGTITVQIPAGTYLIDSALTIYSNTNLILTNQTVIKRTNIENLMLISGSKTGGDEGGYNRIKNIKISGGTWDGNAQSGNAFANMFYLFHGENVTISNVVMKNCCGNHFIELAGIKTASITGSTFRDFKKYNGTTSSSEVSTTSEAIQLDYTSSDTSSGAAPSDGTVCRNITISGCTFVNCLSGIGNHHTGQTSNAFTFSNNSFNSIEKTCFNLYAVSGATVSGNSAENIYQFAYITSNNGTTVINENEITRGNVEEPGGFCIDARSSQDVQISNNEIDGFDNTIYVNNTTANVDNNTIMNSAQAGICFENGSTGSITNNNINNSGTHGINIVNSDLVIVSGNIVNTTTRHGVKIDNSDQTTVQNNTVTHPGENGIAVSSSNQTIIKINQINNVGEYSVVVTRSEGFLLDNNTISTAVKNGIEIGNSTGNITNNTITNCEQYNINVYGTSSGIIENNTYDLSYGINPGNMTRKANIYLGHDKELLDSFMVYYHLNDQASASSITTEAKYGEATPTKTINELGFTMAGKDFLGWKMYRNDTKQWRYTVTEDGTEKQKWLSFKPDGATYYLFGNGWNVVTTVPAGVELHLYAQWESVFRLPANLTEIKAEAFMNDNKIKEIILGNKVKTIGSKAFANMTVLEYITIPDSVTSIADDAFSGSSPTIRCKQNSYAYNYAVSHSMKKEIIN